MSAIYQPIPLTSSSLAENKRLTAGVQEPAAAAENTNGSEWMRTDNYKTFMPAVQIHKTASIIHHSSSTGGVWRNHFSSSLSRVFSRGKKKKNSLHFWWVANAEGGITGNFPQGTISSQWGRALQARHHWDQGFNQQDWQLAGSAARLLNLMLLLCCKFPLVSSGEGLSLIPLLIMVQCTPV